jgi:hypothetical protein
MWWKAIGLAIVGLTVFIALAISYGKSRWESQTRDLRRRLEAARKPVRPGVFDARELQGLPAPVQRYFGTVLHDGQRMIAAATAEHTGTFNMGETTNNWKPFASDQRVVTQRPGFLWDGRVAMMPGLSVHVHDAYVGGVGALHAAILGLVTLVDMRGTGDVAEGELMRFFAEAAWYPTALLPSQGVRWEAVDDRSALGTLTDGAITRTMLFRFNDAGLMDTVHADARGRSVAGKVVPTPWEGRWSNYELRDGMQVPMDGVVAWLLPEGPKPYWRGRITRLEYEFAQ